MAMIVLVVLSALILNIPFGILRVRERRLSWRWFLWVHMPVPVIVAERIAWDVEIAYIPLIILAALAGQYIGGRIGKR